MATGQIRAPFGSPRGGGGQPQSTHFPRGAAPRLKAPGTRSRPVGSLDSTRRSVPPPPPPVLQELRHRLSCVRVWGQESCAVAVHRPLRRLLSRLSSIHSSPQAMSRANWNISYEKGLVNIMRDHVNIPMFRDQNGWTGEGWISISKNFAQMFPLAHFTKQQLQEKEKELRGNWKAIRDALEESGVSWNESLSMVIAEPDKWIKWKNTKVAKFQKKPFPLYEDYTLLYHDGLVDAMRDMIEAK